MDPFSICFLVALASFLIGVWVGSMNSREFYEKKAAENAAFWLQKRDEWQRYYASAPPDPRNEYNLGS
jgi:hypothetical protein